MKNDIFKDPSVMPVPYDIPLGFDYRDVPAKKPQEKDVVSAPEGAYKHPIKS